MEIGNASKKAIVCRDAEMAKGFFRKGLGLMFRKELAKGCGLLMDFSSEGADFHSIWMPFMRFPIDIVFIGPDRKVTDVFHKVPPIGLRLRTWKVYAPSAPALFVLELPAGAAKEGRISPGDKLKF
jgi:uncharacterized membrane protein (UPF0127 family)